MSILPITLHNIRSMIAHATFYMYVSGTEIELDISFDSCGKPCYYYRGVPYILALDPVFDTLKVDNQFTVYARMQPEFLNILTESGNACFAKNLAAIY